MSNRISKLFAEGLLIVASILVAFTIDAWWNERQERGVEQRLLMSLKAEFEANAKTFPIYVEAHRRSHLYALELSSAMQEAGYGVAFDFNTGKLAQAMNHRSSDPQRGALDAILQSGELRYISNPTIRESLAGWPRMVVDATENEDLLRNLWSPKLIEAMAKDSDLYQIQVLPLECWEDAMLEQCKSGSTSISGNTEIAAYLGPIAGYSAEAARELQLLKQEAEDIVSLIDQELLKH